MPSVFSTLKNVANKQLYEGVGLHFVPRGLVYPVDFGGLGRIRYGKKAGTLLPLLVSSNRFELDAVAILNSDKLTLTAPPAFVEDGGFVFVGQRELHEVEDVNGSDIFLTSPLLANHVVGTYVYHYSNPIVVEGNYLAGSTVINVDTPVFLVRGDVLCIPTISTDGSIISFTEYQVADFSLVSIIGGVYQYQVTFTTGIIRDIEDGEVIQLRAYMAYQSNILSIPFLQGMQRRVSGPFLVDWVSAPLQNKMELDETQTVYLYNGNHTLIEQPRVVTKNTYVLNAPIRADQFLFWQKVYGSINYNDSLHRFMAVADKNGRWRLKHTCGPVLNPPSRTASGYLVVVEPTLLNNNENFVLNDSIDPIIFEYKVSAGYVATPSAPATGSITINALPTDNQWLTLSDGFGHTLPIEFQVTGTFLPVAGKYTVDTRTATLFTDVSVILSAFIESFPDFLVGAVDAGPVVNLTHERVSTKGNQPILLDPTLPWVVGLGLTGGTNTIATIDVSALTTDLEVAQTTCATINATTTAIKAAYPALTAAVGLTTPIPGAAANIPITKTVLDPGFIVSGMTNGSGGFKWHFKIKPTANALFKVRFYPNAWQTFNLLAGVENDILVEIFATDAPVQFIDLLIKTTANSTTYMGDWLLSSVRVGAIAYEYVFRGLSSYEFASSTLLLKQIFQSLDDVASVHDSGLNYDSGCMRL